MIARRLARLSPLAHDLAGMAAVIGREFRFPLLAQACRDRDDDALLCGLDELLQRRIVRECPDGSYDFSHGRLHEVAYEQLSAARRQVLHRRVAEALEALPGVAAGTGAGTVAAHYAHAGCRELAIRAYVRAAHAAQHIFAPAGAVDVCRRALALPAAAAPEEFAPPQARALAAELEQCLGDGLSQLLQHEEARAAYGRALAQVPLGDALARARAAPDRQ